MGSSHSGSSSRAFSPSPKQPTPRKMPKATSTSLTSSSSLSIALPDHTNTIQIRRSAPMGLTPQSVTLSEEKSMDLTHYFDSITVVYQFWRTHVSRLSRDDQQHLAMLMYSHVFRNLPSARRLFIQNKIEDQAMMFFDMFGWLIRRVATKEKAGLKSRLKQLGKFHRSVGVKPEYFGVLLDAVHMALENRFDRLYTLRVRFGVEQIYMAVANVMNRQDLESVFDPGHGEAIEEYLIDIETCLRHPIGSNYLSKYMADSFASEIYMFMQKYYEFQRTSKDFNTNRRDRVGRMIVEDFIDFGSPMEINLSYDQRRDILEDVRIHGFVDEVFDVAKKEMIRLINENFWVEFKSLLCGLCEINSAVLTTRIRQRSIGRGRRNIAMSRPKLRPIASAPL